MTSYGNARPQTTQGFASPRFYFKITAPVLALVAILGFVMNLAGLGGLIPILEFDVAHNIVHLLLAAVGFYLGFGASEATAKAAAKVIGVVYLALAVVGFLSATVFGIGSLLGLHLELGENLIHLALGGYAAYVGFAE